MLKPVHLIAGSALLALATAAQAERDRVRWPGWFQPDLRPPAVVGENSGSVRLRMGQLLEVRMPVQAGTGYSWPFEGLYRDAKPLPIGEGTNENRRMLIGRELVGA